MADWLDLCATDEYPCLGAIPKSSGLEAATLSSSRTETPVVENQLASRLAKKRCSHRQGRVHSDSCLPEAGRAQQARIVSMYEGPL